MSSLAETLVAWGAAAHQRERQVQPRLARVRSGRLEQIAVEPWLARLGSDGLLQAAAVLGRTVAPDEPIALLRQVAIGGVRGLGLDVDPRTGLLRGWTTALVARAEDGFFLARFWNGRHADARRKQIVLVDGDLPLDCADALDWSAIAEVDVELDDLLAQHGFPGAKHRPAPTAGLLAAIPEPSAARPPTRPAPIPARATHDGPELRWEAARADEACWSFSPRDLARQPFAHADASAPPNMWSRPLHELLARGWRTESQAFLLAGRVQKDRDAANALTRLLTSRVPERVKRFACTIALYRAIHDRDRALADFARAELYERLARVFALDDGAEGFLGREWADNLSTDQLVVTADISSCAVAAAWRVTDALASDDDAARVQLVLDSLQSAARLRDYLLLRCGHGDGSPGEAIERLGGELLKATEGATAHAREEPWRQAILGRVLKQTPSLVARDFAAWHAAALHSFVTVIELKLSRGVAGACGDAERYGTDRVSEVGLFEPARQVLARHVLHHASWTADAGETPTTLALLARAHRLGPDHAATRSAYNEARFAAGIRDADLARDLAKETHADQAAAPAAELLVVAISLGLTKTARFASRVLSRATESSAHAWMARAICSFHHPTQRCDRTLLGALLESAPTSTASVDTSSRLAHALYERDPARALADLQSALRGQLDALEWALLVREVGLEPAAEPSPAPNLADAPTDELSARLAGFHMRLTSVWPLAARATNGVELRRRAAMLGERVGADSADLDALERELTDLLADASAASKGTSPATDGDATVLLDLAIDEPDEEPTPSMRVGPLALERSRRELATPEWAIQEGLRQIAFFNLADGARDAKMLRGTRDDRGALWELRHRDARHPIRVLYRLGPEGPTACAILAKQDDAHQRRMIARVRGWSDP